MNDDLDFGAGWWQAFVGKSSPSTSVYYGPSGSPEVRAGTTYDREVVASKSYESILQVLKQLVVDVRVLHQQGAAVETYLDIVDLNSAKYHVIRPLKSVVTREDGIYTIELLDFDIYGEGECIKDALDDLKLSIVENFQVLLEENNELSDDLAAKAELLKQYIAQ